MESPLVSVRKIFGYGERKRLTDQVLMSQALSHQLSHDAKATLPYTVISETIAEM